ncbi:DUF4493 domain-containing protein [Phocaeicola plebeius]|uniref:DUF4493 domain-containing protein n=1 Tax=Phocaeicola plebeius TaxID=310297 RepID=UPI0021ACFD68|nr:DUF4493 domain-containing protein [Phocaeicola plebeius]MCR8882831.1 DUF4493 domain-containing protein [Phocaeicola plebeius]MDM8287052.1 DUF4493 domain-containing protein [Phocaeicola plebeius]
MKRYKSLIGLLALVIGLSSCEMRDEILGKGQVGPNDGVLELDLSSVYNGVKISRADATVDNGTTTGNFADKDINTDDYTLVVTNTSTQEEVAKGTVSELKNQDGKILIPLEEGDYTVEAYNYEGENVTVSERPFFKGEQTFSVKKGVSTAVSLSCKLACVELEMGVTSSFTEAFKDDYAITVDNGNGATQVFDKDNLGKKYYFKTPAQQSHLTVAVKATSTEGNFIELTATVQKPTDAEGNSDLADGDSFVINLTEEGATDSYLSIGLQVDLTFTEVGETIEIPVENITYDGPEVPDAGGEEGTEEPEASITFEGLPADYTCTNGDTEIAGLQDVHITAPNGIKNLNVTISGEIAGLLGMVKLPETFDICNMDDELKSKIVGLELVTEEEYSQLHAGTCTDFTFKLEGLLVLIPQVVESGSSVFNLSVSDGVNTKDGDITVVVNPKQGE